MFRASPSILHIHLISPSWPSSEAGIVLVIDCCVTSYPKLSGFAPRGEPSLWAAEESDVHVTIGDLLLREGQDLRGRGEAWVWWLRVRAVSRIFLIPETKGINRPPSGEHPHA